MDARKSNVVPRNPTDVGHYQDSSQSQGVGQNLHAAKASRDKETSTKQETLSQAKGRAQITATSAMSIVNVALLKNVIDHGSENNSYYMASLVLISVSLILQVFAGLLALLIDHVLAYMDKYGQNMCEDLGRNLCPCRCVPAKQLEDERPPAGHENVELGLLGSGELWESLDQQACKVEAPPSCCCCYCPYMCTMAVHNHADTVVVLAYKRWRDMNVGVDLQAIKLEKELNMKKTQVQKINTDIQQELTASSENDSGQEPEEQKSKLVELRESLAKAESQILEYQESLARASIVRDQDKLLQKLTESMGKNRVVMLMTFWQNILNYVFYAIFVLNAFITGFGLATPLANTPPMNQYVIDIDNVTTPYI